MTNFYIRKSKEEVLTEVSTLSILRNNVNKDNVHTLVICSPREVSGVLGIWVNSEEVLPDRDEYKSIVFELKMLGFL